MKFNAFNKRLAVLEEQAKPRLIATLADFVIWCANGCEEEVEFTPAMKEPFRCLLGGDEHEE
jgi:hypothetical protein